MKRFIFIACLGLSLATVRAADTTVEAMPEWVSNLVAGLNFRSGEITLRGGLAKLNVPADFRYLDPDDSAKVLTDLWGNPPTKEKPLGMLFPAGMGPVDPGSWAVVIGWSSDGYVKDDDAEKMNYDELLADMKKGAREDNVERMKEGYLPIELVGWAAPPRYDKEAHKMYWAKELKFGDEPNHTLNYDIRMLGRRGVLVLQAIAGIDQLGQIEMATPKLLSMVEFNEGHRYVDFDPKTDKVAAYGLAALIAGGVAAKVGLFKGLWLGIIALKKFIIIGLAAVGVWIKKLFSGGKRAARP